MLTLKSSHRPNEKIADILAPTHIRRTPYSPTQGPNVRVNGGIVCTLAITLTVVYVSVASCLNDPMGDPTADPMGDPTGFIIGIIVGVILALALTAHGR